MEVLSHLPIGPYSLLERPRLYVGNVFPASAGLHVPWEVSLVGRHQIVVQRNRVGNEFDYTRIECQGQNFVSPDPQVALSCELMVFEKAADLLKDLLHDCVLAQVVISSFVLGNRQHC